MKGSDSHRPLTPERSGFPLPSRARVDQNAVADGPLLFHAFPWILDASPCPRETLPLKASKRSVRPAGPGETIGVSDDINFGVYPHASLSFLSTLRTRHH